jgi:GrpB-like predicted nucleotidyltransferase (UPF0157 family)
MIELRRAPEVPHSTFKHVGSTAVPDLASKPIIDIAVGLAEPIDEGEIVRRLCASGYVFRGDKGSEGELLFVRTDDDEVRTVHVHVIAKNSIEWNNYLRFRDGLHRYVETRESYERLKDEAAAQFADNRARTLPRSTSSSNEFCRSSRRVPTVHRTRRGN